MIESHTSPEIRTASLLHRFHNKKIRIAQLEKKLEETRPAWEPRFYATISKHLFVARAMKEVLLSEILKYQAS